MLALPTPRQRTLNVCFWAGPGVGKSVAAARLFVMLKKAHITCENVTEYAKELQYDGLLAGMPQMSILQEQHRRLKRVQGHVAVAVTDAPPGVARVYAAPHEMEAVDVFLQDNVDGLHIWNVLLERDVHQHFEQAGRWQCVDTAKAFHHDVVVPHVRGLTEHRLFELHVDDPFDGLVRAIQDSFVKFP